MKTVNKPVLMPSALSASFMLWSAVFALYFVAAVVCYQQFSRLRDARVELSKPKSSAVSTKYFAFRTPAGWETVSEAGDTVTLRSRKGESAPMIKVVSMHDPALSFRAVDSNPAAVARIIDSALADESFRPPNTMPTLLSVRTQEVLSGVTSVQSHYALGGVNGLAVFYFIDDTGYLVVGAWPSGDARAEAEANRRMLAFVRDMAVVEKSDRFRRPVIDSSTITSEAHERCRRTIDRELALWELYAARVEREPAASLMPAIAHFRQALTAASSIREEEPLIKSAAFGRYQRFLQMRQAVVREWFVLYDKYIATGDLAAADRQAKFIIRHATLEEEALDRRRATEAHASLDTQLHPQDS